MERAVDEIPEGQLDVPPLIPARMLSEMLYCERLFYLEWVQSEFADNEFVVEGRTLHRSSDERRGMPPAPEDDERAAESGADPKSASDAAAAPGDEAPRTVRSLWLSDTGLGLTAKIDILEVADGAVVPVEHKRGRPPAYPPGSAWPADRAQVCAQALLLRAHGLRCTEAAVWYAAARRRVAVPIDDELIAVTLAARDKARELARAGVIPPPLVNSPKCAGCSLVNICLPDEVTLLAHGAFDTDEPPRPGPDGLRRLIPARDETLPLYVNEQGAKVGLSEEHLVVKDRNGDKLDTVRLTAVSQVNLYGNVQVTTQALRALMSRGVPVSYFTTGGWFCGRSEGHGTNNAELRTAQYRAAGDRDFGLRLARGMVAAKVRNCRTLLRRNGEGVDETTLARLEAVARDAATAPAMDGLLGIEGTAARLYFGAFTQMLKPGDADVGVFDLTGRNRRPPRDPINALLSWCYALLAKELTTALSAVGLDPLIGFYHRPRFGRPALALDLMEEFRPLVADSVVLQVVNNGIVRRGDFDVSPMGVALKNDARRRVMLAYERRMDQLITHPIFDYRISYRRVLEVQSRLLARTLLGELPAYPSFMTR